MEGQVKPKVTTRIDYTRPRPASPFKQPTTSLSPPLIRPKAKVNSSATIQPRKVPAVASSPPASAVRSSASALTRAPSPFKPPQSRTANTSPSGGSAVKARLTARTNGNNSTSPYPESRQRALTAAIPSEHPSFTRPRRGSASSQLLSAPSYSESNSTASSPVRSTLGLSAQPQSDENTPAAAANVRVKAKVSKVAASSVHSPPSLPASPRLGNRPARVPSISKLSLTPPLMPISAGHRPLSAHPSTSVPTNRFGSAREAKHHSLQPLSKAFHPYIQTDDSVVDYGGAHNIAAKVDPAAIPLPPQSPPISTLSFSSRSSASRSSVSYETHDSTTSRSTAPTLGSHVNGNGHVRHGSRSSQARVSIDGLVVRSEPISRDPSTTSELELSDDLDAETHQLEDSDDEERKIKAAAKSNRKIADLEITNRSLLAINATLEAAKHKQAKEIRELRRKLRESRLILPPPAYRAVKSSLSQGDMAPDDEDPEDDEDDDEDEDEDDTELIEGKADEAYRRVKSIIDGLLDTGRRALESTPEDFCGPSKGGAKVLTAEEVLSWRGDNDVETRSALDVDFETSSLATSRPLTPSRIAVPDEDEGLYSEDEVEASPFEPEIRPPARLPPITVTPSASP